jgi:hypothetical protein
VLVKVAKGDIVLESLNNNELNALKGYLDKIGFVGTPLDTVSLDADRLRFEGTIFYSGEYVETEVKADVIEAINNYLESISLEDFNGTVIRERLVDYIQDVEGVVGVDTLALLLNGRPNSAILGDSNNSDINRSYVTSAGYIIEEDTAGNTFNDTITMQLG